MPGVNRTARLPRLARLIDYEKLTPTGTIRLRFDVVDDEPFDFVPGQFVAIDMDSTRDGYRRSPYCLLDGSEVGRIFDVLVRRVEMGPVSIFLADLEIGDVISFRGPSGHSMLAVDDHTELVMIATGVGVSPCYCLLRRLRAIGTQRKVRLFWGLRLVADICLVPDLDAMVGAGWDFGYSITLSSTLSSPNDRWRGLRGRVTESVPPLLETLSNAHFYLVGNGEMIAELSQALQNLGVGREQIYEESFFNHRYHPDEGTVARIEDRFVATDIDRPIERLERELGRFRSSGDASGSR